MRRKGSKTELTKREKEVLDLIAEGESSKMIAPKLFISISTVEAHRTAILNKTGSNNMTEAVIKLINKGVIESVWKRKYEELLYQTQILDTSNPPEELTVKLNQAS